MLSLVLAAVLSFGSDPFCAGFEEGFAAGYCGDNSACLAPLAPLCPLPPIGQETYAGGFRVGVMRGAATRAARGD